jgi:RHS repeat-associated protein
MGNTKSSDKEVAASGDICEGNVPGAGVGQQFGPLLAPGDPGFVSPDEYKAIAAAYSVDGDPVDAFSGLVVAKKVDLEVPGLVPVQIRRHYSSAFADEATVLGRGGWSISTSQWVEEDSRGLMLKNEDGRVLRFPAVSVGEAVLLRSHRLELRRLGEEQFTVYSLGTTLQRHFESTPGTSGRERAMLTRVVDRRGNALSLSYDKGQMRSLVDTAGRQYVYTYDALERLERIEVLVNDRLQQAVTYGYHATGELATMTDALGFSERYEYDGRHRLTANTRKNGVSFYYQYEPETGECIKTWGDGGLHRFEFHRERSVDATVVTTSGTHAPKVRVFNPRGDLLSERNFAGDWERRWEFDDDHLVLAETDAAGKETRYTYDQRGNVLSEVDAAGNVTLFEYQDDQRISKVDPLGRQTKYLSNSFGELVGIEYPTGTRYSFEIDRYGRLTRFAGSSGTLAEFVYDDQHNLTAERTARGGSWTYVNDAMGRPIQATDPSGATTRIEYDSLGQKKSFTFPDGTSIQFDYEAMGNVSRYADSAGLVTAMEYVGTGSLKRQTAPDGSVWTFEYDVGERLVSIRNPKAERYEVFYDTAGRLVEERTFDGRTLRYEYSAGDRVSRVEFPDGTYRAFAYDKSGNLVFEDSPHGSVTYERTSTGRLSSIIFDEGRVSKVSFIRDDHGRIVEEIQGEHSIRYEYDAEGRRLTRTVPGCGTTHYEYDLAGVLVGVHQQSPGGAELHLTLDVDILGREVARRSKDGKALITQAYDNMDRLVEQKIHAPSSSTAVQVTRTFGYDPSGRLAELQDTRFGAARHFYDQLGQVVRSQLGDVQELFEYQANGSLQRRISSAQQATEPETASVWDLAQGNILLRTGRYEYEYDACHRRTAKIDRQTGAKTRYVWDCRSWLREVWFPDGRVVRYFYDGLGRRTRKELYPRPLVEVLGALGEGGTSLPALEPEVTDYLWDEDELAAELSSMRGDRGHLHYYRSFVPLLQVERDEVFVVVTDHLGAPRDLVAASGEAVWGASFDAWGKLDREFTLRPGTAMAPAVASPFRLLGQFHDEETGFNVTRFRLWDPDTGRWLSPDPLGILGGENLLGFNGCALVETDPYGLNTSSDAKELRDNMVAAGIDPPEHADGTPVTAQAHHIVASNDPDFQAAQAKMNALGVPTNAAENGIFMANRRGDRPATGEMADAIAHRNIHTDAYRDWVNSRILACNSKEEVEAVLKGAQRMINSGDPAGTFGNKSKRAAIAALTKAKIEACAA